MSMLVFVALLIVFAIVAARYGADSRRVGDW